MALATFPARTPETRPAAVILADEGDWRTRASPPPCCVGRPIGAPMLFAESDKLPAATSAALDALQPTGSKQAGGAQVIRMGTTAPVPGYKTSDVAAGNPAALAAALDRAAPRRRRVPRGGRRLAGPLGVRDAGRRLGGQVGRPACCG